MSFDLSKIGQVLKAKREERGLNLQEISNVLFIRKRIVEAVENANWEILPHDVYVRGYVEQYASFLGVRREIEEEFLRNDDSPPYRTTLELHKTDNVRKTGLAARKNLIGFGAVGAGILVFLVIQNVQRPSYVVSPAQGISYPPAATYQTSSGDVRPVSGAPYENRGETVVAETKKLMIACQQRTWVRIIIDGTEKKEFMMNPEEVIVLNGKDGFDLLIGNAGGVKLFYNGKDTGFAGEEGEVRRINLPEVG